MLTAETIGWLPHAFRVNGRTIREIARDLQPTFQEPDLSGAAGLSSR